jgi:hypothetical protein
MKVNESRRMGAERIAETLDLAGVRTADETWAQLDALAATAAVRLD